MIAAERSRSGVPPDNISPPHRRSGVPNTVPRFAHRSEEEFARLLDFYALRWNYEPRSFAVAWDEKGIPVRFFTPDFYLVDYDLYIEVTTIKQKLITRKHQKLRKFHALYPEINIKLLNLNDFRKLMMKYGRSARELAGSRGKM